MEGFSDKRDMIVFAPPHLLQASSRDPDKWGITVVQPVRDNGVDQLLSIRLGEGLAEFGDVFEVEEEYLTEVVDVGVKCEV